MFDFSLPCRMSEQAPSKVSRRQWDSKNMEAAIKAVQEEGMTVSGASKQFSVPRKILDDRIKGCVKHGCKPGSSTALTAEEESA